MRRLRLDLGVCLRDLDGTPNVVRISWSSCYHNDLQAWVTRDLSGSLLPSNNRDQETFKRIKGKFYGQSSFSRSR